MMKMRNVTGLKVAEGMVFITVEEREIPEMDQCLLLTDEDGKADGLLHYGIGDNGIVSFGVWYEEKSKRPGHGGYWSSRAGAVTPLIGIPMVQVSINRTALHMTVPALESLLRQHGHEGYRVVARDSYGETVYEAVKQ